MVLYSYSTTSHLAINILSILHHLGSPLVYYTLIFDLMRNLYIFYYTSPEICLYKSNTLD